jgi:hypothetical protein
MASVDPVLSAAQARVDDFINETVSPEEAIYRRLLEQSTVPPQLHDGLVLYLTAHIPPGSFLTAVLSNDLIHAVNRGDDDCLRELAAIVRWLYRYAPHGAWGSVASVEAWLARRTNRRA